MEEPHISLAAEELFSIGPIPVTNSMVMMFVVMALVLGIGTWIARKAQTVPTGKAQGLAEMLVGFLLDLVEGSGGKRLGRRIFPLISGIFIFILFANFSGLLPGVGSVGVYEEHETEATEEEHAYTNELASTSESAAAEAAVAADEEHEKVLVPFMRPPTADLNMTFALSVIAFISIQIAGISAHGAVGRIKHMANPPFLFPIELIGELSRILSLSARLFGNVFAGEILLGVMYSIATAIKIAIIPVVFPVIFIGLEVMFGTIQALVFALLTLIYIMLAAAHDDHHEEEHAHSDAHAPAPAASPSGD
jgi:F-type H+-transporting ATPase subunit a